MKTPLLLVLALSCALGCQRETKKKEPTKETTEGPQPTLTNEQPATREGLALDLLAYLPKDGAVLVGLSVTKTSKSKIFQQYRDTILASAAQELAEMKEKCGIDMMADVRDFVVAIGNDLDAADREVIAIRGNFDKKKFEDCVVKTGGKVEGSAMTSPDGTVSNTFWVAADTLLISKGRSSDELEGIKAAGVATQNKVLMDLVGKVDPGSAFWVAGTLPPEAARMFGIVGVPPKSGYLSVKLSATIEASAALTFATEDEAKAMATMVEMGLNMGKQQEGMKEILGAVRSGNFGNSVTMDATFTAAIVDQVIALAPSEF